jgi:ABC-type branched-subunit amino acid transport system substrate-binding protein
VAKFGYLGVGMRLSRRKAVVTLCVVVGALAAGIVASSASGARSASLKLTIGALVPNTGTSSAYGPSTEKGIRMGAAAVVAAAKKAGIDFTATVDAVDNQSDPVATVSAARKLTTDGATCLIGASSSATTAAAATSVAIPQGVPIIAPSSTSSSLTPLHDQGGLTFRTVAADPLEAAGLARVVATRTGGAKGKLVSVSGRNDAYGQGLTAAFAKAWQALGGKVAGPVLYDPNAANYDSEAQQIVSSSPKAYVIIDLPNTYGKVASALLRTGKWKTSESFIAGGYPATIPNGIPPETLNGVTGVSPGFPLGGKLVAAFNKLWARSPGTSQQQSYDQNSFDAAVLCSLAAIAAKSTTGSAIAAALPKVSGPHGPQFTLLTLAKAVAKLKSGTKVINYQGVSGPVDFNAHGDIRTSFINVYQYSGGVLKVRGVLRPGAKTK